MKYAAMYLSCQGLVNKDLSQKISIINSLKWKPVPGSTSFLRGVLESCNQLVPLLVDEVSLAPIVIFLCPLLGGPVLLWSCSIFLAEFNVYHYNNLLEAQVEHEEG